MLRLDWEYPARLSADRKNERGRRDEVVFGEAKTSVSAGPPTRHGTAAASDRFRSRGEDHRRPQSVPAGAKGAEAPRAGR